MFRTWTKESRQCFGIPMHMNILRIQILAMLHFKEVELYIYIYNSEYVLCKDFFFLRLMWEDSKKKRKKRDAQGDINKQ